MANLPDVLEKIRLLHDPKTKPELLAAIGRDLAARERFCEAVDLLRQANATAELQQVLQKAVAAGDLFLLKSVARALRRTPTDDELSRTRQAAAAKGKMCYAQEPGQAASAGETPGDKAAQ